MALTPSSSLHYWSARQQAVPIVGGRAFHTRNSAGSWVDQLGVVQTTVVNTPRFGWAEDPAVTGERRPVMKLELASTNLLLSSEDYTSIAWAKSNITVTPNSVIAPDGSLTADKIAATASAGATLTQAAVTTAAFATYSVYIKKGSGATDANTYGVRNSTTATDLLFVTVNFDTLAVSYQIGFAGARLETTPNVGWYRLILSVTSGISVGNTLVCYTGFTGGVETAGEYSYAWGAQLESLRTATAYIKTDLSTATRALDQFYWDFPHVPQGMITYSRFIERGTSKLTGGGRIWNIVSAASSGAQLALYASSDGSGPYRFFISNGSVTIESSLAQAPVVGDAVEIVGLLRKSGGNVTTQIIQAINGDLATSAGPSSPIALPAAWSDTRLYLGSSGNFFHGMNEHCELRIVKDTDVVGVSPQEILEELRGFELSPNGARF